MSFRHVIIYPIVFLAAILIPAALVVLIMPEGREKTFAVLDQLGYEKSIQIKGLYLLSESDINKLLPTERSVAWWWLNQPVIESAVSKNTLVQSGRLTRCNWWSWSCFSLEIEERKPSLIAYVGDRGWIVGTDGAFIAPVPQNRNHQEKFPIVRGVHVEGASGDLVKTRVAAVSQAAEILARETGRTVSEIKMRENSEIEVTFAGLKAKVIFDLEESGGARIAREAGRLRTVLSAYSGKEQEIESIDLAFDKLAVVKTFEGPKI